MYTTSGRSISVIYPGIWTHSNGPDFSDAMLELDGRLQTGQVELHLKSSDWYQHEHDINPKYEHVVLHVVVADDLEEPVRTSANQPVETLELGRYLSFVDQRHLEKIPFLDLGSLGVSTCLPILTHRHEAKVRNILREKGWERLVAKQLAIQQELTMLPAGEVLHRQFLDGLGLLHNREGMRLVGERLPLTLLEQFNRRLGYTGVLAGLLGTAGFLPLSDQHIKAAMISSDAARALENEFITVSAFYGIEPIALSHWTLNRVRPANHPVRRLASYANLLAKHAEHGLLTAVLDSTDEGTVAWQNMLDSLSPAIGKSRSRQILTNVFAPFVAAYAQVYEDAQLQETVSRSWENLPGAKDDIIVRRTLKQIVGDSKFPIRTALENQGLHQIGRLGCRNLRCFECPIAHFALEENLTG